MANKRVLVVDDEQPIVDLLDQALSEAGYEVDGANSAEEALSRVKDNLYDVAILDFALPDATGVMLHQEIRRMDQELGNRTLFISGVVQKAEDLEYYRSDSGGFFTKPFNVWEILSAVRKLAADS